MEFVQETWNKAQMKQEVIAMRICLITGQQGVDFLETAKDLGAEMCEGGIVKFPESKICHSYDLCEYVMELADEYYEKGEDLLICTWSEVVLDAVRLWVARRAFENAVCVNVLSNGETKVVPIRKNGEMDEWVNGVFDIKTVILREMFQYRNFLNGTQ